jgi:hypothetical protein
MTSFTDRMIGAAKLDANVFEEVEHDATAIGQAMGVVVLAAVAAGIGSVGSAGMTGLVVGTVAALFGWFLWAGIIFIVGTKLMAEPQTEADIGQLLRTIGFAASPGVLAVFGIIPFLGLLVRLGVSVWQLVAMVIAVRQALDYQTTGKAVIVCLIGWIIQMAVMFFVMTFVGLTAAGIGAITG